MKTRLAALSVALWTLCAVAPAGAASFDSMVVIGDSLSDPGNVAARTFGLFPPSPPYNARATNGTTAVEQLAGQWGIALTASMAGGTNFGHIGALTGQMSVTHAASGQAVTTENFADPEYGLSLLRTGTGMQSQLGAYLGSAPTFDPATTLFTVWGGPNDIFLALASTNPGSVGAVAQAAVGHIAGIVSGLASAGARHILVPNMADLGATPFGQALDPAGLTALSLGFNAGLDSALDLLRAVAPGVSIYEADVFGAMAALVAAPPAGLNVTDPCLVTSGNAIVSLCGNPDDHLFWDDVHPTSRGHTFVAGVFAQAVPEPRTYLLSAVGLVVIGVVAQRRARHG
jgi:phospholipase/lecithinase/hemolysin